MLHAAGHRCCCCCSWALAVLKRHTQIVSSIVYADRHHNLMEVIAPSWQQPFCNFAHAMARHCIMHCSLTRLWEYCHSTCCRQLWYLAMIVLQCIMTISVWITCMLGFPSVALVDAATATATAHPAQNTWTWSTNTCADAGDMTHRCCDYDYIMIS